MYPWLAKIVAAKNSAANASRRAKDYYVNNTTSRQRLTITKVIAVIILFVFILIFGKKLMASARSFFHKDIRKIEYDKFNLSYPKSEYNNFASTLEAAMQYSGTDEDSIFDVIERMQNQDDWNFLLKTFGVREKDGGTFDSNITGDLKMWIVDELNDDDRQRIRDTLAINNIRF